MSTAAPILTLISAMLVGPVSAPDSRVESARAEIGSQYARRASAVLKHEIRGVLDILAPGFSLRYLTGQKAARKSWEQGLRAALMELAAAGPRARDAGGEWKNPARVRTVIQTIAMKGDRAVVTAVTTTTNTARDPGGLSHQATLEETSTDTWAKTALGWRLLTIEQRRNRTATDEMRAVQAAAPKVSR